MIAPDRNGSSHRPIDKQDRRRLPRTDRVEKVQLETEKIVAGNCGREDYVKVGHQKIIAGASPCTLPKPRVGFGLPVAQCRFVLSLGAGVTPAQGSVKPKAGFTLK